MKTICIVTDLHLCNNPRTWKEANFLSKNFNVVIVSIWTSAISLNEDAKLINDRVQYLPALSLIKGQENFAALVSRFLRKISVNLKRFLGVELPWLIGYAPFALYRRALNVKADFYILHSESGLFVEKK